MRRARIQNEIGQLKKMGCLQVTECQADGLTRDDLWIVWINGKKDTLWEGGLYPVTISFPQKYPLVGPEISFQKDFQHVHVYEGGLICLPLLQPEYWKPKTTMTDIIQRIANLMHQQINKYSPANTPLYELYANQPEKYEQLIIAQRNKYSKQDIKYFQMPCLHITLLSE